MTTSSFQSLEEAISDEHFPEVDLALRRGRHVGRDDGTAHDYPRQPMPASSPWPLG